MIRTPAVAGLFYPADPNELQRMVSGFLRPQEMEECREVVALMAPHAGLVYSGRVAGATYARVQVPLRIILLGPNHTGQGKALSIWDRGTWTIPGGAIEIDELLCDALKRHCPGLVPDPQAHLREHCLEVQLPFLLRRTPALQMAPVVVGTSRLETLRVLGAAVAAAVREDGPALIVISSDMTHYEPAPVAARKDRLALEPMQRMDPEGLHRIVCSEGISMCGFAPAVAGLFAARELGAKAGEVVCYAHSGEVSGDETQVVGYAGMVFS